MKQIMTFSEDDVLALTRIEHQVRGKPVLVAEIVNSRDADAGSVPSQWKSSLINPDGTLGISTSAEMVSYEINPVIADETFDIDFPVGTEVSDAIERRHYMVLAEGQRGSVELNPNGTIANVTASPWPQFGKWTVWLLIAGGVCMAIGFVLNRWKTSGM
jgi:hypothetical protein